MGAVRIVDSSFWEGTFRLGQTPPPNQRLRRKVVVHSVDLHSSGPSIVCAVCLENWVLRMTTSLAAPGVIRRQYICTSQ